MRRGRLKTGGLSGCFGWGFVLFWSAITLAATGACGWNLIRQCLTYGYEQTTGTIVASRLEPRRKTVALVVEYAYVVDGQPHTGTRYRYGSVDANASVWRPIQADLPAGKEVPVYYRAGDPAEAVLLRGPMGLDLFALWFLTPFNLVALGGWLLLLRGERPAFVPADPRTVRRTAAGWEFRPMGRDWWLVFLGTLFAASFVGVFVIGFAVSFNPPLELMAGLWAAALAGCFAVANLVAHRPTLEFDELHRTLTLPRQGLTLAVADVTGFAVEPGNQTTFFYVAVRHGEGRSDRIGSWSKRETASAVAGWLTEAVRGTPPY
jgi:hypothetical protein